MIIKETQLSPEIIGQLISLSGDWEKENSCYGYKKNTDADLKDKRIFIVLDNEEIIGYLFGYIETTDKDTSIYKIGTKTFEVDELYVKPSFRNRGIGKKLFKYMEETVKNEVEIITLGTATKNYKSILHFYIEELDMKFWSAALFKKITNK